MKTQVCSQCNVNFDRGAKFCCHCASELIKINVTCNMCGLSCNLGEGFAEEPCGLIEQSVSGGFESTPGNGDGALDDDTTYTFSLCEFCLDWMFSRFKNPPNIGNYMSLEPEKWRSAYVRVTEDVWRSQKDKFKAEYIKREAARKSR